MATSAAAMTAKTAILQRAVKGERKASRVKMMNALDGRR